MQSHEHVRSVVEQLTHLAEGVFEIVDGIFYTFASDGFDAADAGSDAAFAHNLNHADVAGVVNVCTATELD